MRRLVITLCGIYLAAAALAAATTGHGLIEPVPHYRMSVFWMMPETLQQRLDALVHARRIFEAEIYAGSHAVAWGVIMTLVFIGALRPLLGPSRPLANIRTAAIVLGGAAGLMLLTTWTRPLMEAASQIPSASTALSSMPGYWLLGMAISAAVLGANLSLVTHDMVLFARRRLIGDWAEPAEA